MIGVLLVVSGVAVLAVVRPWQPARVPGRRLPRRPTGANEAQGRPRSRHSRRSGPDEAARAPGTMLRSRQDEPDTGRRMPRQPNPAGRARAAGRDAGPGDGRRPRPTGAIGRPDDGPPGRDQALDSDISPPAHDDRPLRANLRAHDERLASPERALGGPPAPLGADSGNPVRDSRPAVDPPSGEITRDGWPADEWTSPGSSRQDVPAGELGARETLIRRRRAEAVPRGRPLLGEPGRGDIELPHWLGPVSAPNQ